MSFKLGNVPWNKGKSPSLEVRAKLCAARARHPGHPQSLETREKIRIKALERDVRVPGPMKGKKHSSETKAKIRAKMLGRTSPMKGKPSPFKGKPGKPSPFKDGTYYRTPEAIAKMMEIRKKISIGRRGKACGEKSSNWKGGISYEPYCYKFNTEFKQRVRAFFDYRCIICGKHESENCTRSGKLWKLSVHHVTYNKKACCDDNPSEFALTCMRCHTETNWNRESWMNVIHIIIHEIYGGRSYFTKDEWCERDYQ